MSDLSFRHPEAFIPPYMTTPDFLHAAMRPDMITETEVEISTEGCCEEEDEEMVTLLEPVRKSRGKQRCLIALVYRDAFFYLPTEESEPQILQSCRKLHTYVLKLSLIQLRTYHQLILEKGSFKLGTSVGSVIKRNLTDLKPKSRLLITVVVFSESTI